MYGLGRSQSTTSLGKLALPRAHRLLALLFLWNTSINRLGAIRTSNYIYLNPAVTAITSWLILGERLNALGVVGAIGILCGVYYAEKGWPLK